MKRGLIKEVKKIWFDLLTNPVSGKYGRKSWTWLVGLFLFTLLTISGTIYNSWAPEYIFIILTSFILGIGALSVWDKNNKMKNHEEGDEDIEPPNNPNYTER